MLKVFLAVLCLGFSLNVFANQAHVILKINNGDGTSENRVFKSISKNSNNVVLEGAELNRDNYFEDTQLILSFGEPKSSQSFFELTQSKILELEVQRKLAFVSTEKVTREILTGDQGGMRAQPDTRIETKIYLRAEDAKITQP